MRIAPRLILAAFAVLPACPDPGATPTTADDTASSSSSSTTQPTTGTTAAPTCTPGEVVCLGDAEQSVCDANGQPGPAEPCPGGPCVEGKGCSECAPGDRRCMGLEVQECGEDSTWQTLEVCNELQGLECDEATGACAGACLPGELGLTATGCEFFAVTTLQLVAQMGNFGVVIENPGPDEATITITSDDFDLVDTVPAGAAKPILLPWIAKLTYPLKGELVYGGAYHVQSDRPVRAIQYSTIDIAASSDASLLWPRHTWGTDAFVGTRASRLSVDNIYPGAWAIVGGDDETMVTVTPRPGTTSKAGPGIGLDGGGKLPMSRGDILQIISDDTGDLTGAHVTADKPIQVFGAHLCGFAPEFYGYCDHLEEAMLPTAQLGTVHVPVPPMRNDPQQGRRSQLVRVIATDGPTDLMYDPPQLEQPTTIAATSEFVELEPSNQLFTLTTSKPVVVVQYMVGNMFDGDAGDPSMLQTLPVERFAPVHYVHTLAEWLPIDVDITAPVGAMVTIDGAPLGDWTEVGGSGFAVKHVRFDSDVGLAEIAGDQPIAVNVYATHPMPVSSFWYGAGGSLAP